MRSEQYLINISRDWRRSEEADRVSFTFPAAKDARGFYPYGFVRRNDSTADLMGWYGFRLEVSAVEGAQLFQAEVAIQAGHQPIRMKVSAPVQNGAARVELHFDTLRHHHPARRQAADRDRPQYG